MRLHLVVGAAMLAALGAYAQDDQQQAMDQAQRALDQEQHAIAQAVAQAKQLAQLRVVQREGSGSSYLGIGARDVDAESARKFNLKEVRGTEITAVAEDSPAAKAGLKPGDVVLEFNGQPVEGAEQLTRMVRETPVGRQVRLGVWRNGAMQTVTAVIEAHNGPIPLNGGNAWSFAGPTSEQMRQLQEQLRNMKVPEPFYGFSTGSPVLGIMGEPLGQEKQLAEFFGVQDGVLVKSVNRDSAGEKAGIKAGDVIVKVDDAKVSSSRDITMALRSARSKKTVTVMVVRNKKEIPLTVTVENSGTGSLGTPVRAGLWVRDSRVLRGDCDCLDRSPRVL